MLPVTTDPPHDQVRFQAGGEAKRKNEKVDRVSMSYFNLSAYLESPVTWVLLEVITRPPADRDGLVAALEDHVVDGHAAVLIDPLCHFRRLDRLEAAR